jgi:hypothetical protein
MQRIVPQFLRLVPYQTYFGAINGWILTTLAVIGCFLARGKL